MNYKLANLGERPLEALRTKITDCDEAITSLRVSSKLGKMSVAEWHAFFMILSQKRPGHLGLSGNRLGKYKTAIDLIRIFMHLPECITSLDLACNHFSLLQPFDLAMVMSALPGTVGTLRVCDNQLDQLEDIRLSGVFAAVSHGVTAFHCSANSLGTKQPEILASALSLLKPSLKLLDVSNNELHRLGETGLQTMFATLPKALQTLDLIGNDLEDRHLRALFPILRESGIITLYVRVGNEKLSMEVLQEADAILSANRTRMATGGVFPTSFFAPQSSGHGTEHLRACVPN